MDIRDGIYTLVDGTACFKVGGFAVRVAKTDEGMLCEIYPDDEYSDALASCWALDNELIKE